MHEGPAADGSCVNNNGTTYTYNQAVLLSGLGMLYQVGLQLYLNPTALFDSNSSNL
jgi:hypothetical protein